jgi:hypothetical protein
VVRKKVHRQPTVFSGADVTLQDYLSIGYKHLYKVNNWKNEYLPHNHGYYGQNSLTSSKRVKLESETGYLHDLKVFPQRYLRITMMFLTVSTISPDRR